MIHICILFFAGAQRISFCSQVIGRNLNKTSRGNKMDDDDNIHIQNFAYFLCHSKSYSLLQLFFWVHRNPTLLENKLIIYIFEAWVCQ